MISSLVVRILVEKASFWSNHHCCPTQTRYGTQAADDAWVTFPQDPLGQLVEGRISFVSKSCIALLKQDMEQ
jgi:hypothetical protein